MRVRFMKVGLERSGARKPDSQVPEKERDVSWPSLRIFGEMCMYCGRVLEETACWKSASDWRFSRRVPLRFMESKATKGLYPISLAQ